MISIQVILFNILILIILENTILVPEWTNSNKKDRALLKVIDIL